MVYESPELDDVLRIRCEKDLKPRLKAIAERHNRKMSNLVLAVLRQYAESEEIELREQPTPYRARQNEITRKL